MLNKIVKHAPDKAATKRELQPRYDAVNTVLTDINELQRSHVGHAAGGGAMKVKAAAIGAPLANSSAAVATPPAISSSDVVAVAARSTINSSALDAHKAVIPKHAGKRRHDF